MHAIRALVFDLDYTLMTRRKEVRTRTAEALIQARQAGYKLVIATSRPIRAVRRFVPKDLLNRCTLISLNGAVVHEFTRQREWQMACMGLSARRLIEQLAACSQPIQITAECWGEDFATNRDYSDEELWQKQHARRRMVKPLECIEYGWISKVTADGQGQALDSLVNWPNEFPAFRFLPALDHTLYNIVPQSVDKSTSVIAVLQQRGIHPSEMMVFADDMPDLKLMESAGVSVAMGNAVEAVCDSANVVIGDCDTDAIAEFLHDSGFLTPLRREPV